MRVLLAQNMFFHRTHGGANKSNRIMMEELAARGHDCHVVAPLSGQLRRCTVGELLVRLADRGVRPEAVTDEAVVAEVAGVRAHFVVEPSRLAARVRQVAASVRPDWTLVPSDDPGLLMLGTAEHATPGRVVYLAHTLQQLPFGARAFYPSEAGTRLLRRAAGVVAVSEAARRCLMAEAGIPATLIRPHVYGPGPYPRHRGDAITMVNPSGYKGIAIFLALADALPERPFAAVPTWGTTERDRAELSRRPNVRILEARDDIDEVLAHARMVVMPSLWDETFGYTAVEAMLRGIPVLAADVGGLAEAKLGVPYLLPVRPIGGYAARQGQERPEPAVLAQDPAPWLAAVRALDDPAHHSTIAEQSRTAATAFVASLDSGALETYLRRLTPAAPEPPVRHAGLPADGHRLAALARLLTKER